MEVGFVGRQEEKITKWHGKTFGIDGYFHYFTVGVVSQIYV
jgi:hypothetical protein